MNGFLVLLILLLLFLLYLRFRLISKNKDERSTYFRIKAAVDRVVSRHKLSISEIDFFKNTVIGLDRRNKKLVLIIHKNNVVSENCLRLDEVSSCRVSKEANQLSGCTKNVTLQLNLRDGEIVRFTFFDETRDKRHELHSRFKKAVYWQSNIQLHLNNIKAKYQFEYVV